VRIISIITVVAAGCGQSEDARQPVDLDGQAQVAEESLAPVIGDARAAQDTLDQPDSRSPGFGDLGGISPQAFVEMQVRSFTYASLTGLCLEDDGRNAWGGVYDVTCPISTRGGNIGFDERDYEDDDDDPEDCDEDELFVLSGNGDSATWDGPLGKVSIVMDAVFTGGLMDHGVVALGVDEGDCLANLVDAGTGSIDEVDMPTEACSDQTGLEIDRASNTAWFANGSLWRLSGDGTVETLTDGVGNLVAYDAATATLVGAAEGDPTLASYDLEGNERWSFDLSGSLMQLEPLGDTGVVVALTSSTPTPTLYFIDALTGDVLRTDDVLPGIREMTTSADGSVIGVVMATQAYFYDVRVR